MAKVNVKIDVEVPKEVKDFVELNERAVAHIIEGRARNTRLFTDKTGRLRKSIKAKESRYEDGGWIVQATAPHAWLVENGHDIIHPHTLRATGERVEGKKFLRIAKEQTINDAIRLFGVIQGK